MQIKRYEAKSTQEALARIKRELGPDAIILSSKQFSRGGGTRVEVVAAKDPDERVLSTQSRAPHYGAMPAVPPDGKGGSPEWEGLREDIGELRLLLRELKKRETLFDEFGEVKDRLNVLFDLLGLKNSREKTHLTRVYSRLVRQGVSRKGACVLLESLNLGAAQGRVDIDGPEEGLMRVEELIRGRFRRERPAPGGRRIQVFVGPSGVGKTTTIAKLAARYALGGKHRVGLATTDTYRIAAPEQLRTYAGIMDIPMQVAADEKGLRKAIEGHADRDIILVDTPGTGLGDVSHLERMKGLFHDREGMEMNLLLCAASSRENRFDTLSCYEPLRVDQVILTKVDECRRFGFLFDVLDKAQKPVPYVTTGQNVPGDIQAVNAGDLARLIVNGTLH